MMTGYAYVGGELDLFAAATNWKAYFRSHIQPYLGNDVLEVGAGLGGTTRLLCSSCQHRWVCLEPDQALANRLAQSVRDGTLPATCAVMVGTLERIESQAAFDTLLYIDVLEHIENDRGEVARAADCLRPGGHVVVLAPAHGWLYTPFDQAIGHYRRYTKRSLTALTPDSLELVRLQYLDSVGLLASLGNRLLLKRAMPNAKQIAVWDKVLVRLSRIADPLVAHSMGKSVLGVWQKK
ncbi:MAG TPA: class I SAM-dependent methyltransferase [Gemmataceae bacterium]|nr:class I SAM-dependent methyltransferase [Gemmataceae bacterium]